MQTPEDGPRDQFIANMRNVANTVAIVATKGDEGLRGLVVSAWCSVSADPPTVLVCVNKDADAHDHIMASERFTLNVLSTRDVDIVTTFSGQGGLKGDDRFDEKRWVVGASGQPVLNDAICTFDCRLASFTCVGSHSVFFGTVLKSRQGEDGFPLIYYAGGFIETRKVEIQMSAVG